MDGPPQPPILLTLAHSSLLLGRAKDKTGQFLGRAKDKTLFNCSLLKLTLSNCSLL